MTPAERDEEGRLPYGKELRASDDDMQKKRTEDKQSNSASRSFSSGVSMARARSDKGYKGMTVGGNRLAHVQEELKLIKPMTLKQLHLRSSLVGRVNRKWGTMTCKWW
jgi:hypothetical protein